MGETFTDLREEYDSFLRDEVSFQSINDVFRAGGFHGCSKHC